MSAPVASETRSPLSANREIRARSMAGPQPGGHQKGADLVAVQADGERLVVQTGRADVHCRGDGQEPFFFGVAVEAGHRAQAAGHRRPGPSLSPPGSGRRSRYRLD